MTVKGTSTLFDAPASECVRRKLEYLESRPGIEQVQLNGFADAARKNRDAALASQKAELESSHVARWKAVLGWAGAGVLGAIVGGIIGALGH